MRLINLKITGFRRLADINVNLDGDVIAIVGPNEAGKSTLLDAMNSLQNDESIDRFDITRGKTYKESDPIIEARFLLEPEEIEFAGSLGGIGKPR